jgi:hypothetical protein
MKDTSIALLLSIDNNKLAGRNITSSKRLLRKELIDRKGLHLSNPFCSTQIFFGCFKYGQYRQHLIVLHNLRFSKQDDIM